MNRRAVTLIELLITIVIGSIAMLALAVPFSAERIFWLSGRARTEAQRDAQLALRAMARMARQSACYDIVGADQITLYAGPRVAAACTGAINGCFRRAGNQFESYSGTICTGVSPTLVIDGGRSQVTALSITRPVVGSDRLVQAQLTVSNRNTAGSQTQQQQTEQLLTELYLRNAT